ncbi:MAG TPA: ATP-binding protein [Anaeromyxobacteraceae bacterium]|nr:ATP-binding protein [Anaeromyxobacteraceae bacterium]
MPAIATFLRSRIQVAIRALQEQLAGGPRAQLPPDLELLGQLVHSREECAKTKDEPERELLAALPDAGAVLARDGTVRLANAAFETLAPGGHAVGLSPLELTRSAELGDAVRRALEGHGRRLYIEGPRRVWLAHLAPLLRGEVLLLLRDVTETRRAEAIRRDFVANASHELRTPVAAIRAAAETLLAGALADPDGARRFVDMVARQAERLARLTQDLLDLSRIESGQWSMELGPVELSPLVQGVLDLHADRAEEKELRLTCEVPEGLSAQADARALEQVLVNLIDNAVKYTPAGGLVTVGAAADGSGVTLTVDDTGPGIDRHHLPRLFERFYRVDPGRSREQGGTGLGLAIVKHLTQAQGGEVGVESGSGGTRFWVKLPGA